MDRLDAFGKQVGFVVQGESDVVRAVGVPCLLQNANVSTCTIEKFFDPVSKKPDKRIGNAIHAVRIRTDEAHDGRVYHANGEPIGNYIDGNNSSWSDISIKNMGQDDETAKDIVHRYAKQIVGAVFEAGYNAPAFLAAPNPFKIPNTFEARSDVGLVQDRIRGTRIAIIGLGGTGSYILDLMAKTPVAEIHLLDADALNWHNFMRAPGAPTSEEIESQRGEPLGKVAYHHAKYSSLREGIHAHKIRVEGTSQFAEFLAAHPIDFAFVCIDQLLDSDSPRQDDVYAALSDAGIPFIDSGISITLVDSAIRGSVTTSAYSEGSLEWQDAIPNARTRGDRPGYRNVQLPEVNALAAALAVMEWRRRTGQYVSESPAFLHKFLLEGPTIRTLKINAGVPLLSLRPIFVDLLPDPATVKDGELWISPKHRTVNLRCPCGCGDLSVLSLLPSRWHIHFDGKTVSLDGPTGGSVWRPRCGSHFLIKNNTVIWANPIDPDRRDEYAYIERQRLLASQPSDVPPRSWLRRIFRLPSLRKRRDSYSPPGSSQSR